MKLAALTPPPIPWNAKVTAMVGDRTMGLAGVNEAELVGLRTPGIWVGNTAWKEPVAEAEP